METEVNSFHRQHCIPAHIFHWGWIKLLPLSPFPWCCSILVLGFLPWAPQHHFGGKYTIGQQSLLLYVFSIVLYITSLKAVILS